MPISVLYGAADASLDSSAQYVLSSLSLTPSVWVSFSVSHSSLDAVKLDERQKLAKERREEKAKNLGK